jgi:hypothetical protein
MVEIPARRRMLETLLVQSLLEAEAGFAAAAADYATAVLMMADPSHDRELEELASGVLRRAGVVGDRTLKLDC